MSRDMTVGEQAECVALTNDILALLAEKQASPGIAHAALINTLVEIIKHLGSKDTLEEAATDLIGSLQRAIKSSAN